MDGRPLLRPPLLCFCCFVDVSSIDGVKSSDFGCRDEPWRDVHRLPRVSLSSPTPPPPRVDTCLVVFGCKRRLLGGRFRFLCPVSACCSVCPRPAFVLVRLQKTQLFSDPCPPQRRHPVPLSAVAAAQRSFILRCSSSSLDAPPRWTLPQLICSLLARPH